MASAPGIGSRPAAPVSGCSGEPDGARRSPVGSSLDHRSQMLASEGDIGKGIFMSPVCAANTATYLRNHLSADSSPGTPMSGKYGASASTRQISGTWQGMRFRTIFVVLFCFSVLNAVLDALEICRGPSCTPNEPTEGLSRIPRHGKGFSTKLQDWFDPEESRLLS